MGNVKKRLYHFSHKRVGIATTAGSYAVVCDHKVKPPALQVFASVARGGPFPEAFLNQYWNLTTNVGVRAAT